MMLLKSSAQEVRRCVGALKWGAKAESVLTNGNHNSRSSLPSRPQGIERLHYTLQ